MNWKVDDQIEWKNVEIPVYKFVYENAEKRLQHEIDLAEKITLRSYVLMGILLPLITSLAGVVMHLTPYSIMFYVACVITLASFVLLRYVYKSAGPHLVWQNGFEPKRLFEPTFIDTNKYNSNEVMLKLLYVTELEKIQNKILQNQQVNQQRIKLFSNCLTGVIVLILLVVKLNFKIN